jgi:hypothetical protein
MEIISEFIYWAVLLYTPIYWFIGLVVLGGYFIAGNIWSVLRAMHYFALKLRSMSSLLHIALGNESAHDAGHERRFTPNNQRLLDIATEVTPEVADLRDLSCHKYRRWSRKLKLMRLYGDIQNCDNSFLFEKQPLGRN